MTWTRASRVIRRTVYCMINKRVITSLFSLLSLFTLSACEVGGFSNEDKKPDPGLEIIRQKAQRDHELKVACISSGRDWIGSTCRARFTLPERTPMTFSPRPQMTFSPLPTSPPTTSWFDKRKEENKIRCIATGGTWFDLTGSCY
jgi:hypothetical protein